MSNHLPTRLYRPLHRQCLLRRPDARSFTTTIARPRRRAFNGAPDYDLMRVTAELQTKKSKLAFQEEASRSDGSVLPDDLGLLPGSFIRAPHRTLPSPFMPSTLQNRLWYEWKWATSQVKAWLNNRRFKNALGNYNFYFWVWNRSELRTLAKQKYCELYRAFAAGKSSSIYDQCLSGVSDQFARRIAARRPGLKMQWKVENLKCSPWFKSNRATMLSIPNFDDTGIHQIVLRMTSRQTLEIQHDPKDGQISANYSTKSKDVVEYLVLQRMVIRGRVKDWTVWGFAEPWQVESIERDEKHSREVAERALGGKTPGSYVSTLTV